MAKWPYSTAAWQRLRKRKLNEAPLCEDCLSRGRFVIAEQVDHIKAIRDGGEPFPSLTGLRALCPSCHSSKTNRLDNPHSYGYGTGPKGCDLNGMPLDPDHPWNNEPGGQQGRGNNPPGSGVGPSSRLNLKKGPSQWD